MPKHVVKLNHAEIGKLLRAEGRYRGVRDELTRRMERVEAKAKADAPVETGAYRDSIHIEQDTTDRAVVRVVADVPHAHLVEANTGNLSRALDAAGGS